MKITLLKPHTHAGEVHSVDAELNLDEPTAQWLIAQGVARDIDATESPLTKSPSVSRKGD
jgi:hypothetical protein